jgi:hypothetical protein
MTGLHLIPDLEVFLAWRLGLEDFGRRCDGAGA